MDNLPNDPSNPNNNSASASPTGGPPPPPPPPPPHIDHALFRELAKHRQRDVYDKFSHTEQNDTANSPAGIQVIHTEKAVGKDPPLVDLKVINPVTYLKNWLGRLLKNQDIDIRVKIKPFATLALIGAFFAVFGVGYNFGLNSAAKVLFPNSSPILKRAITVEGAIQKSSSGKYYLSANGNIWTLNPISPTAQSSLKDLAGKDAAIKGNLTAEKNLINVSEVIALNSPEPAAPAPESPSSPATPSAPASVSLPSLYGNLQWEKNEKKVLLFTSGKRRIEQEGIYLESVLVKDYPQEFINYYINELTNAGFKQTLNSTDTNGTTITYAKDNAFFTFGIKYSYTGSTERKTLSGYKAFLEHN